MAETSKISEKGSSSFHMSTKVYYQPRNDPTLTVAEGKVPMEGNLLRPVQVLHSATDRSIVPLGEFDALPMAEKTSPTQLFCFESRKGTDLFNEVPNDSVQLTSGKNKEAHKVSFSSGDLIDSEDLLRLECLQGGAFKMFIPASPELERPPLCFEIKPPANVILDLPKCEKKPNIKVVVTTICSTGNPNEQSNYQTEGGMDVETSNLDDSEIEELIRELCQVIVETHKREESSPPRKTVREPPQVVELYKRTIMSREPNASGEYLTYNYSAKTTDGPFSYDHDDSGYFYFQPQTEQKGSSVSFLDKICGCLGRTLGLIPSDSNVRRRAPMKMEVDNDPEEGYVRCLLMGKTPNTDDDDDCPCDQQPVAEIRNSAELMDKQSPLVDRIMYLLRKSVGHKYSSEELVEGGGNGDFNKGDSGNNGDDAAGVSAEKVDVHVDSKDADKASRHKNSGAKHHTHFGTEGNKEFGEEVDEEGDDEKKKKTGKKKRGKLMCCTHAQDENDKISDLADLEDHQNVPMNIDDLQVDKVPEDEQKRREKRKKKSDKMEIESKSNTSVETVNLSKLDDPTRYAINRPSRSLEEIDPCVEDCKMAKRMRKPEKMEAESKTDVVVEKPKPPQPDKPKKRSSFRKSSSKSEVEKTAEEGKKGKNKKKTPKSSDDESDSSKKSMKKDKKKERKESRERFKDSERTKMIGHRDKAYWASYRRLRRRQMEKPEAQFKESVVSANISVDPLKMSSESSSGSDSLIVEIESDIAMHRRKNKTMTKNVFDLTGKRKSYGKLRTYDPPMSDDSSDSSVEPTCSKSAKVESRQRKDDAVKSEVCKTSSKSKHDRKLLRETPSGASVTELPSQKSKSLRHRQAIKDIMQKFKTLRTSKSSTKSLCEDEDVKPSHKKSQTKTHRRKQKEDNGIQMFISGSPKEQDDKTDPRNISAVIEAQALKDEVEKSQPTPKDKCANDTSTRRDSSSNDVINTENDSAINLVIPCGTHPSEEADFVGLSSWKNPITKSTTAIDSKCDTLCSKCMKSISSSPTISLASETSSPTTSITSRKSILVDRRQPASTPRCSSSVYSMCEVSLSGSPMTYLPAVASLDSKLRHREQLEKLTHLDSPIDFISLRPETDSSNQTLDSSSSAVTNNSSSVEVETKSTNFDSGTSVVSNVTIDSALSQNPFNTSKETEDTTKKSNSTFKARELSSTTVDTWSSTSASSDILGNQSSTSYQESTSANDLASGLSSDGSRSLISSAIESLPFDLNCDDGSLSLLGESSGDSRSTVALSTTSAIDSELSMNSQATSESIQTQDSLISRDIAVSDSVSSASKDPYQNDSRSRQSYSASETGSQASNAEQLNRGALQRPVFSQTSNSFLPQSAISLKLSRTSKAKSTTSLLGSCNAPLLKDASQRSISFTSEKPAVMKIQSFDTVLATASNTHALKVSPSKESSTESINRAKQICMQVPDIGPTFTNAMISSSASCPGANDSPPRSDSDQGSSVESVVETEGVEGETTPERTEIEKSSNNGVHGNCCSMLHIESDESLRRDEDNDRNSADKLDTESEKHSAENLDQLPTEKSPSEGTIVEELVEHVNNSNAVQPNKKKISRRKHIMATFLCISKPCQSARESDSFAPYRPAQNTSGLDGPRNLSDTIPQIDRHPPSQPHRSKRPFADHSKSKKTVIQENNLEDNTHRTGSDEVKLKSILSKTLHKDNRYKLTKKVSFSPNPSFIEAAATPDGSTSRSQSEHESEIQAIAALTKLRAFDLRSSSSNSIVPLTPSTEDFRKKKTLPNSRTSLIRTRESFSGETNRDLWQRDERGFKESQSDDSDTCSSREDEDDLNFETNSGKSQESFQARLQLSNLMCESIPPKSSEVGLNCLDNFEKDADVDCCGLALLEEIEESFVDVDERCRENDKNSIRDNGNEDRFIRNMSSPNAKESKMCLVKQHGEKSKMFSKSKTKPRDMNFLKDCPIENEDAKLEQQNSVRKMLKKRQLFAQKVSSLMKVTPLDVYDENLAISDRNQIKEGKKAKKDTSRNSYRDEDRSAGQRGAPKEVERRRKPSR